MNNEVASLRKESWHYKVSIDYPKFIDTECIDLRMNRRTESISSLWITTIENKHVNLKFLQLDYSWT